MKLVVSGYYGFDNCGDEALLLAIKKGFSGHKISVLDKKNRFNFSMILKSDVLISGGGGLLQDKTSSKSFLYYAGIILFARLLKKKIYIFAQSIGPITNFYNKILLKHVLNSADLITVRDENSFRYIESLKLEHKNILQTDDPTLTLVPAQAESIRKTAGSPYIGICPRSFKNMPPDLAESIASLCGILFSELKANIVLIPFHGEQDYHFCKVIANKTAIPIKIVKYQADPLKTLGVISQMDLVIGMRLHSLIFAVKCLVPAIGISYDPKVESFMEKVSLPVLPANELNNTDTISNYAKELLDNKLGVIHSLEIINRKLYANAQLNFELLKTSPLHPSP